MSNNGYPWIKFYTSMLDDRKFLRLSDAARAHYFALYLLAGRSDAGGLLAVGEEIATIDDLEFALHLPEDTLEQHLRELITAGLVAEESGGGYTVTRFQDEQGSSHADTREAWNSRQQKRRDKLKGLPEPEPENNLNFEKIRLDQKRVEESREEKKSDSPVSHAGVTRDNKNPSTSPLSDWQEQVFRAVTGLAGVPGGDAERVKDALNSLGEKYESDAELIEYLKPFFNDWINKKGKNGKPYSPSNCAWLYDKAIIGNTSREEVTPRLEADPNCPICGGVGKLHNPNPDIHDPNFGKYLPCDCVKQEKI